MINENLTKDELDLVLNYRQGKYKLDITEEEYNLIVSKRNLDIKIYEKYIENIEILTKDKNNIVASYATKLLIPSKKLHNKEISLDEYKLIENLNSPVTNDEVIFKINCLNYIKESIVLNYPN